MSTNPHPASQTLTSALPSPVSVEELIANDPVLSAIGMGKDLWADEPADEYAANLRQGW